MTLIRSKKTNPPPQTFVGLKMMDEIIIQIDAMAGPRQRAAFIRKAVAEKLARDERAAA